MTRRLPAFPRPDAAPWRSRASIAPDRPVVVLAASTGARSRKAASRPLDMLACLLVSFLLVASAGLGFSACAEPGGAMVFLATGCATLVILHGLSAFGRLRPLVYAVAFLSVAAAVATAAVAPSFRRGLARFGNQVITRFDDVFGAYAALLPSEAGDASGLSFYAALGILVAVAIWILVDRRLVISVTAAVFGFGTASLWLDAGYSALALTAALAAWVSMLRMSSKRKAASLRHVVLACVAGACAVAVVVGTASLYRPVEAVDDVRAAVVKGVEDARYGSDSLPQGDLAQACSMNEDDRERLALTFDSVPENAVVLRGFVGASYDQGSWQALDHAAYEGEWTGLFDWLATQEGFAPATQRALYHDEQASRGEPAPATRSLSIESVGADRAYLYVPSTLRSLSGADAVPGRDGASLAEGLTGAHSISIAFDDVGEEAAFEPTPAWLAEESSARQEGYAAGESVYRAFADARYLEVDDADRALLESLLFAEGEWEDEDGATLYAVASRVRAMLATLASYTDQPVEPPSSESALSWFLTEGHQGNSAYFSTAAVLAFRTQGVPARYAEGYLVDEDSLARLRATGESKLVLTDADAHAWVEVYCEGVGWIPLDATPGFYEQPYAAKDIVEVNQSMAGGDASEAGAAGAVGGSKPDDQGAQQDASLVARVVPVVTGGLLVVAAVAALSAGVLEGTRAYRRRRRAVRMASDDQDVAVSALFDQLSLLVRAAGAPFDPLRPLACSTAVAVCFPEVAAAEYERAVSLVQRRCFGGKQLRAHEMRALRRFVERLASGLAPAEGLRMQMRRRYRDAL